MEVTGFFETLVTNHNVEGVVTQKNTAIVLFKICLFKSRVATQMVGCDSRLMVREFQKQARKSYVLNWVLSKYWYHFCRNVGVV
jgi:hypothetical protein